MRKMNAVFAVIAILILCAGCKKNAETHTTAPTAETIAAEPTAELEPTFGLTRESPEDEDIEAPRQTEAAAARPTTKADTISQETTAVSTQKAQEKDKSEVSKQTSPVPTAPTQATEKNTPEENINGVPENAETQTVPVVIPGAPSANISGETPED